MIWSTGWLYVALHPSAVRGLAVAGGLPHRAGVYDRHDPLLGLCRRKNLDSNRLNLAFPLAISILLSAILSPYGSGINPTVENWLKIAVFYVLVVSTVRNEEQMQFLVVAFLVVMALYVGHSYREFRRRRHRYAMGVARMVGVDAAMNDPNTFGATILYALPMVYPLWYEARKRWQKLLLIGFVLLACGCILLTGSRSAFVGICILPLVVTWFSKHRYTVAIGIVIAAPLIWLSLREDLKNRYLTLIDPSYGPANAQASAEGRTQGFWDGINLWQEHLLTGVGPGCHGIAMGHGMQAHNLSRTSPGRTRHIGRSIVFASGYLLYSKRNRIARPFCGPCRLCFPGQDYRGRACNCFYLVDIRLGWGITSFAIPGFGMGPFRRSP